MLQTLLKVAIISALIKALKPRLKGLLVCGAALIAVFVSHDEYLSYVELTNDHTYLARSYWYKYSAITLIVLLYILFGELRRRSNPQTGRNDPTLSKSARPESGTDDGFDFIREEGRLMTRGEKLLAPPDKPES